MPTRCSKRFVADPADAGGKPVTGDDVGLTQASPDLTEPQLDRWAQLLADGEVEFPDDLPAGQAERLLALVRRRRRNRLVTLIARQIARQIGRDVGP